VNMEDWIELRSMLKSKVEMSINSNYPNFKHTPPLGANG